MKRYLNAQLSFCCCFIQNNKIIQITTVQHELDQLRRKLDDTKMKLIIEIKVLCNYPSEPFNYKVAKRYTV